MKDEWFGSAEADDHIKYTRSLHYIMIIFI